MGGLVGWGTPRYSTNSWRQDRHGSRTPRYGASRIRITPKGLLSWRQTFISRDSIGKTLICFEFIVRTMSQKRVPGVNVRYLYYRYMNKLEKEINVKLGFGLFAAGVAMAGVGLALFLYSITLESFEAYATWAQPAYALALLALPLVLLATVILLPPDRRLLLASGGGLVVCLAATVGFLLVYPSDWQRFGTTRTMYVLGPYAVGVGVLTLGMAASMREHAPELIETVTQIHSPEPDDGDDVVDPAPGTASDASVDAAASGTDDGSSVVDDVPDETAVVDDGSDLAETAVVQEEEAGGGPAGTGEGPITLVVNGRRYSFGDGDTFGRREGPWLDDLIVAADGHDEIPFVSGDHLEFSVEGEEVYVTDVSRNGTKLNGRDVSGERVRLSDGDTLVLADRAKVGVEL